MESSAGADQRTLRSDARRQDKVSALAKTPDAVRSTMRRALEPIACTGESGSAPGPSLSISWPFPRYTYSAALLATTKTSASSTRPTGGGNFSPEIFPSTNQRPFAAARTWCPERNTWRGGSDLMPYQRASHSAWTNRPSSLRAGPWFSARPVTSRIRKNSMAAKPMRAGHRPSNRSRRCLGDIYLRLIRSKKSASRAMRSIAATRSEEHTSELQSHSYLVCRLLLEKKIIERTSAREARALPRCSAHSFGEARLGSSAILYEA